MKRALPVLFAIALGLISALLLCNYAVCEQDDSYCAFTGVPSK